MRTLVRDDGAGGLRAVRVERRGHEESTGPGDPLDPGRGEGWLLSGIWSFKNYCGIC